MPIIFQVDAFTNKLFSGNPAGVCLLDEPASAEWMQNVAAEMNLPETAFVVCNSSSFDLRWFTPAHEEDLCGHATLASAHILFENNILAPQNEAVFHTKSGRLIVRKKNDFLEMDFPAEPEEEIAPPPVLLKAVGVIPEYTGKNRLDILIQTASEAQVRAAAPDMQTLADIPARGIIVTAPSDNPEFDFVSRFFAPGISIPEDPVTGSAHCCLGPFWQKKTGKTKFHAFQASQRGGIIDVECKEERVLLSGQAVTFFRGNLVD